MIGELQKPQGFQEASIYGGFWPKTNHTRASNGILNLKDETIEINHVEYLGYEEFHDHYCGPHYMKPKVEFNPCLDVHARDYVLVWPCDTSTYPIWHLLSF